MGCSFPGDGGDGPFCQLFAGLLDAGWGTQTDCICYRVDSLGRNSDCLGYRVDRLGTYPNFHGNRLCDNYGTSPTVNPIVYLFTNLHESAHISIKSRLACQSSSFFALVGSA